MRGTRLRHLPAMLGLLLATTGLAAGRAKAAVATAPAIPALPRDLAAAEDSAARLTILVTVNEQGPYPFVIDTGADRTVISSELAAMLNLPAGPHAALHDIGGVQEVPTALIDRLSFGGLEIRGIDAPLLAAGNLGAAGMLGIDSLHGQQIVMDFAAHTLRLAPAAAEPDSFDPHVVIVEGRRRFGQLVLIDSESRGTPIFVILDSGAQNTIGNAALQHLIAAHRGKSTPTEIISVTGRKTTVDVQDTTEISLGTINIRNVPIAFADLHTFAHLGLTARPAMLLGMDVLRHFRRVSVDFARREAVFVTE